VKSFHCPHLGRTVKLGRNRPKTRPKLHLAAYLTGEPLPTPPATVDYASAAHASLSNVYKNDVLGDCVIAALAHLRGVTSAAAGRPVTLFTDDQIVAMYSAIGGYVPGDESTDNGCDEITALDYLVATGYPDGVKLAGAIGVDATNATLVKIAIWLFGGVVYGQELPTAWLPGNPLAWGVAGPPQPQDGHATLGCGYSPAGVDFASWGELGLETWDATAMYAAAANGGELHAALSPDLLDGAAQKAPSGFDWDQLRADLAALGPSQ
jgi:hypothetical protein